MNSTPPQASRGFRRPELLLIAALGLMYAALAGKYRPFDIDLPWVDSYAHALLVQHTALDTFRLESFPAGPGGTVAFGKLAALLQGIPQLLFGWSAGVVIAENIALVVASLVLLAAICRHSGFNTNQTVCAIAFAGFMEPLVKSATTARYEPFTLFLLTVSLLLALRGWAFTAALIAFVAMETQPVAVLVPLCVVIVLFKTDAALPRRQLAMRVALGAAIACCFYGALHPHILQTVHASNWHLASRKAFPGGFLPEYFAHYPRHLLLLAFLAAAAAVAVRRPSHLLLDWPGLCLAASVVVSILLRSANQNYVTLLMPMLSLFVIAALWQQRNSRLLLALIVLTTVPQYAYRLYFSTVLHATLRQTDQASIGAAIDRAALAIGKRPDTVHIAGDSQLWFAHPAHFHGMEATTMMPGVFDTEDLIVCSNTPLDPVLRGGVPCSYFDAVSRPLEQIAVRGYTIQVRQRDGTLADLLNSHR